MCDRNALIRAAIGRLLSEKTGAALISMKESIAILRARTDTALDDDILQDLLIEMAEVRGMTIVLDL